MASVHNLPDRAAVVHRGWRRLWLASFALALVVVACGWQEDPPPVAAVTFDLVAERSLAAASVDVVYDRDAAAFVDVAALNGAVIVRAHEVSPGRVRVAWVSGSEQDGAMVRLRFGGKTPDGAAEELRAYGADGAALPGGAVSLVPVVSGSDAAATRLATVASLDLPAVQAGDELPELEAWFAEYPLGDVDRSGSVDVVDALRLLGIVGGEEADAYQRFHGDVDGDALIGPEDVLRLLDKTVDPELPALTVVKPSYVTFLQMLEGVPLLVGNGGNDALPFIEALPPPGVTATREAGLDGQTAAFTLDIPESERKGLLPGTLSVDTGPGSDIDVRVGSFVLLIAGQSNASGRGLPVSYGPDPVPEVRMFGNDYLWRIAEEPLDDPTDQVDTCSAEGNCEDDGARYSFGTELGRGLWDATEHFSYLVPAAHGGTRTTQWLPQQDRENRSTLFGSSVFRARVSAGLRANPEVAGSAGSEGGPVNVLVWFQGESDASSEARREAYIANTNAIMDAYASELDVPVVYVQLAANSDEQENVQQIDIAERQRRLETGYGEDARARFHMVVANDLPLSDPSTVSRGIHVSAYGHVLLAERIALAIREHVLDEPVDGTGPRLERVLYRDNEVWVELDRPVDGTSDDYAGWFTAFDGQPTGSLDDVEGGTYYQNLVPVEDASLDPADPSRIVLRLAPNGGSLDSVPWIRYAPEEGRDFETPDDWERLVETVVRGSDTGLPLPTFGPLPAQQR